MIEGDLNALSSRELDQLSCHGRKQRLAALEGGDVALRAAETIGEHLLRHAKAFADGSEVVHSQNYKRRNYMRSIAPQLRASSITDNFLMEEDEPDDPRRAKITDEHRAEASRLREIWAAARDLPSQAEFGRLYGIGLQPAVSAFLKGRTALSLKAATGFAKGLGCTISDFSPRLAREAQEIAATMLEGHAAVPTSASATLTTPPAPTSIAGGRSARDLDAALRVVAASAQAASPVARGRALRLITVLFDDPEAFAEDQIPAIVRQLSGELGEQQPQLKASGGEA